MIGRPLLGHPRQKEARSEFRSFSRRGLLKGAAALGLGAPVLTSALESGSMPAASAQDVATPVASPSTSGTPVAIPTGYQAEQFEVIGYSDLDGRAGGFKMAIQQVNDQWLLYMGHLWDRGWSILDVTDPQKPEVLNFISGPDNTWTIQMEIADGKMITALEQMPESWGGDPNAPFDEGVLIWDLTADPVNPKMLGHYHTGGSGTHRDFYAGGRYVHLAAGMPGYEGNIYVAIDIDDPTNPVEAGRWWVPGQHVEGGETPEDGVSLHGPPYVVGSFVYIPYGAAGLVILDISDISKPKLVGQLDFSPPFNPNIGVHSALPLVERNMVLTCSESIRSRCQEPLNEVAAVDISDLTSPTLMSLFPVPRPPSGSGQYQDFCEKGGRFGPHNFNMHYHSPFTDHSTDLIHLTYFDAGLRIFDIHDPRLPTEVGYFIPPEPTHRYGPQPPDALVLQSEDVLVDSRGYAYLTNKNQGMWIVRYTGPRPGTGQ